MKLSYRSSSACVFEQYNSQNLYNFTVCDLSRTLLLETRPLYPAPH